MFFGTPCMMITQTLQTGYFICKRDFKGYITFFLNMFFYYTILNTTNVLYYYKNMQFIPNIFASQKMYNCLVKTPPFENL